MASRLPGELQKAQRRGVQQSALVVTRSIRQQVQNATGGDSRLSGVGRRGARVGVRYEVKGTTNPTALIRATGPMHLLEHNTAPHMIQPKRKKIRALRLANGSFAAHVRHPGTRAKVPFEKGYLKARDETGKVFDQQVQQAIVRVLR